MSVPDSTDTTDLREGPEIHQALLGLLPLVGVWEGTGTVVIPESGEELPYTQRITVAHDGRPFLLWQAQAWLMNPDGGVLRAASREQGFWRPGGDGTGTGDEVELVIALNTGIVEVFTGLAGDQKWDVATSEIGYTPSAKRPAGERRLLAIIEGDLFYVEELAMKPGEFRPHLNARLART